MQAEIHDHKWNLVNDNALKQLNDIQSMIDIMSERLVALRDLRLQEYIKQDIQSLEEKILKNFCKQLSTKRKVPKDQRSETFQLFPSLSQWLIVAGVGKDLSKRLIDRLFTVEKLLECNEDRISFIVQEEGGDANDVIKLNTALRQLKQYQGREMDYNENIQPNIGEEMPVSSHVQTTSQIAQRHQTGEVEDSYLPHRTTNSVNALKSDIPSKSANSTSNPPSISSASIAKQQTGKNKKRPDNIIIKEYDKFGTNVDSQDSAKSNRSGFASSASTSSLPLSPTTPMTPVTPLNKNLWLKDSQYMSPTHHTPRTPGKINRGLRAIKEKIRDKIGLKSQKLRRNKSEEQVTDDRINEETHHKVRSETFPQIDVSAINASKTNTTVGKESGTSRKEESRHNSMHSSNSSISEPTKVSRRSHHDSSSFDYKFFSSGMTTPCEASMLIGRDNFAFGMNSYFENYSNAAVNEETPNEPTSTDQEEDDDDVVDECEEIGKSLRSNLMRQTSTTSTMNEEWDIPWDELQMQELIGQGRVGSVYKGNWHGEVAIRVIDIIYNDESKLRAFKHEVMLYKKTRHDNIELFMGSCMNPPKLAIITGFCRGKSLYQYIRSAKDLQVNVNQAKIIAQHIAQGMGYLHSRGIIHKDLKSKNIFIDGKRVVVTDFGLMGLHAISSKTMRMKAETLQIPDGWLCYMAPEVIHALNVPNESLDVVSLLPYTKESDVYAFGTVWYELLTGSWPFKEYEAESIIWQVGNGKKQSLAHIQGPKELKDILMSCWAFQPSDRPDFTDTGIMGLLLKLPQAKIIRRSSQPVKGNKKGGRLGLMGHDRPFDSSNFSAVLHDLVE